MITTLVHFLTLYGGIPRMSSSVFMRESSSILADMSVAVQHANREPQQALTKTGQHTSTLGTSDTPDRILNNDHFRVYLDHEVSKS